MEKSLDLSYLQNISMGNKEFVLKLLQTFVEQTSLEMEKIHELSLKKDWDSLSASAHKIKPSFHFVGALEMEALLNTIEIEAKDKSKLAELPAHISIFLKACKEIIIAVKKEIENL